MSCRWAWKCKTAKASKIQTYILFNQHSMNDNLKEKNTIIFIWGLNQRDRWMHCNCCGSWRSGWVLANRLSLLFLSDLILHNLSKFIGSTGDIHQIDRRSISGKIPWWTNLWTYWPVHLRFIKTIFRHFMNISLGDQPDQATQGTGHGSGIVER